MYLFISLLLQVGGLGILPRNPVRALTLLALRSHANPGLGRRPLGWDSALERLRKLLGHQTETDDKNVL